MLSANARVGGRTARSFIESWPRRAGEGAEKYYGRSQVSASSCPEARFAELLGTNG